jgi:hypothetical protein
MQQTAPQAAAPALRLLKFLVEESKYITIKSQLLGLLQKTISRQTNVC